MIESSAAIQPDPSAEFFGLGIPTNQNLQLIFGLAKLFGKIKIRLRFKKIGYYCMETCNYYQ
jgi:hypothetical protein